MLVFCKSFCIIFYIKLTILINYNTCTDVNDKYVTNNKSSHYNIEDCSINKIDRSIFIDISKYCLNGICLPKCCQREEILSKNKTCQNDYKSLTFLNDVKSYMTTDSTVKNTTIKKMYNLIKGFPKCNAGKYLLDPDDGDYFKILNTGSLMDLQTNKTTDVINYCLEFFESSNLVIALVCFSSSTENFPIGMLVSSVFCISTFFVYAILSELRNLHGLCLMCHVSMLATGYIILSILNLQQFGVVVDKSLCLPLAYSVIFAFLSSFFWLNVMCFDIWWVFSGYRHPAASSKKEIERKKFRLYSIYSWGSPTIIFIILVIMDMEWVPKDYIRPELGVENCFFRTDKAKLVYFYLPLAFILSSNLIFFMMTTIKICKISKETKVLNHGESKRHQEHERQRFLLYVKLFIVMGMNWITELMSFFYPDLKNLWYITDASNTLQGVLIFVIFVWKRRILRLLKLRFCPNMKFLPNTGLSRTKSQSTRSSNMMTHQTSITSTMSENVRMKSISSQSSMLSINKSPM
ncbi:G-protein coupled receptor Mth2-like isoform X2 [Lycorma delicatula]|uniref:G-protein coupled receptor Mth2-like isoform X2 n=1 Tax=Lycorma delicatula TaxID=130591 RepID=UPI003F516BCE